MKKLLAIVALVAFLGGMSAPLLAKNNTALISIELADEDPKKVKAEKKSTDAKAEKKSSDCASEEKASDCASEKKASDCKTEKKSSDCSKSCGGDK